MLFGVTVHEIEDSVMCEFVLAVPEEFPHLFHHGLRFAVSLRSSRIEVDRVPASFED